MTISGIISSTQSALVAQASRVGAVADNVANVSSPGYKAADVRFSSVAPGSGGGVVARVQRSVSVPGVLAVTDSATDLAVAGKGFLPVQAADGSTQYTRTGSFSIDSEGYLANSSQQRLLGLPVDDGGRATSDTPEPIQIGRLGGTAQATTRVRVGANLPSTLEVGESRSISTQVSDSLGNPLILTLNFEKSGTNNYTVAVTGITDHGGASVGTPTSAGSSDPYSVGMLFNGDGSLQGYDTDGDGITDSVTPPTVTVSGPATGAEDLDIALGFGEPGSFEGITQFSDESSVSYTEADGGLFGSHADVAVEDDGSVVATFDNGLRLKLYRIPVATFASPEGLGAEPGQAFRATVDSGEALLQPAGGGGGSIQSTAIEQSNVDLGTEFTRLVLAKSAYTIALQTLQVSESLIRQTVNLKS